MVIENELLDERANNYVLAVMCKKDFTGIAYMDISTGTFRVTESRDSISVVEEIRRVSPAEILLTESSRDEPDFIQKTGALSEVSVSYLDNKAFEYRLLRESLAGRLCGTAGHVLFGIPGHCCGCLSSRGPQ